MDPAVVVLTIWWVYVQIICMLLLNEMHLRCALLLRGPSVDAGDTKELRLGTAAIEVQPQSD